jgi:hypothetical protein
MACPFRKAVENNKQQAVDNIFLLKKSNDHIFQRLPFLPGMKQIFSFLHSKGNMRIVYKPIPNMMAPYANITSIQAVFTPVRCSSMPARYTRTPPENTLSYIIKCPPASLHILPDAWHPVRSGTHHLRLYHA